MKLVEILARDLKAWPKADFVVQEYDGELYMASKVKPKNNRGGNPVWESQAGGDGEYFEPNLFLDKSEDHATAIVTRADWEAERAKLKAPKDNGDGWIRHRGGKCPVKAGTLVDVRYRDGQVNNHVPALTKLSKAGSITHRSAANWDHIGSKYDIMAYRIHKPAEQPAPVSEEVIVEDKTGNLSGLTVPHHMLFGYASLEEMREATGYDAELFAAMITKGVGTFLPGTVEQISGPIEWRDRIRELDTQREEVEATYQRQVSEITQERESLVQELAGEGLALVEDMSNAENWEIGDLAEVISTDSFTSTELSVGDIVPITRIDNDGTIAAAYGCWGWPGKDYKFHSRPTS